MTIYLHVSLYYERFYCVLPTVFLYIYLCATKLIVICKSNVTQDYATLLSHDLITLHVYSMNSEEFMISEIYFLVI